jgi:hypothetical protein
MEEDSKPEVNQVPLSQKGHHSLGAGLSLLAQGTRLLPSSTQVLPFLAEGH